MGCPALKRHQESTLGARSHFFLAGAAAANRHWLLCDWRLETLEPRVERRHHSLMQKHPKRALGHLTMAKDHVWLLITSGSPLSMFLSCFNLNFSTRRAKDFQFQVSCSSKDTGDASEE